MRKTILHITCGLLLATGWANALAQGTTSPAQRLNLELVDNVSNYNIATQQNEYTNTLRLSQPTGDYKLTAGMLNEGDNYITIHRLDNTGGDVECARVNLNAVVTEPEYELVDEIDFVNDGGSIPSGMEYFTNAQLQAINANWSTSSGGQGLVRTTDGSVFSRANDGLVFTVPNGYSNVNVMIIVTVGSSASTGYFTLNINSEGWDVVASATANSVSSWIVNGVNSGDTFAFLGATADQSSLNISPYIKDITIVTLPSSYINSIEVTPTISKYDFDNNTWGVPTSIGAVTTNTPNSVISLSDQFTDVFSVSTATNSHPDSYSYKADLNANIVMPAPGASEPTFNATANFTACTNSNLSSGTFTGHDGWEFNSSFAYQDDDNDIWGYVEYYGAIIFTMPNTFVGNSVNVTVTSGPCLDHDGSGDLYVNGVLHTFNGASTFTWTNVPVSAGGVIEFKAPSNTWSADVATIEISSSNGSSLNMPIHQNNPKTRNGDGSLLLKRFKHEVGKETTISNLQIMGDQMHK